MRVWGAESEAVMNKGRVNHDSLLRLLQQVMQVAEVPVAATHTVSGAILIQHKNLAGTEPTLQTP